MRLGSIHVCAGWFGSGGIVLRDLNFLCEAELFEQPDAVVVDVELVPHEAVASAHWMGVVVVVPAFAAGEDRDPPVIAGVVFGLEAALTPEVGSRIDEPGGVEADGDAEEGSPEHHADGSDHAVAGRQSSTESELQESGHDERHVVVLRQPDVDAVAREVRSVTAEERGLGVESATGKNPTGVSPPGSIVGGVGIACLVGVLMMDAVGSYPEDGPAFEGEAATSGDEVLQPTRCLVAAMGEQAVVGHANANVDGEEVHHEKAGQVFPRKEEEGGDGSDVEEPHGDGCDPVDATLLVLAAHAEVLLNLLGDLLNGEEGVGRGGRAAFDFG